MEFIQCPHCQKQYAVNAKLRASEGKRIRCKHCGETFEIQVHSPTTEHKTKHKTDEQGAKPISAKAPTARDEPSLKKNTDQRPEQAAEQYLSEPSVPEPSVPEQPAFSEQASQEPSLSKQPLLESPSPTSNTHVEENTPTASNKKTVQKRPAKKLHTQMIITIALSVTLIIAALGAFLFVYHKEWFSPTSTKETPSIMPKEFIKPFKINLDATMPKQQNKAVESSNIKKTPLPPIQSTPKPMQQSTSRRQEVSPPSQACKDVSADYWLRTHTMASTNMDTKTYMKLLDKNLKQANEIRHLCKDKSFVGKVAKAARTNYKPDWIKQEINARSAKKGAKQRQQ